VFDGFEISSPEATLEMTAPVISMGKKVEATFAIPEDNSTDYMYGIKRGDAVVRATVYDDGRLRTSLSTEAVVGSDAKAPVSIQADSEIKHVIFSAPKTIELKREIEDSNKTNEMIRVTLPSDSLILFKSMSLISKNGPQALIDATYSLYENFASKYGKREANIEFLNIDSNKLFKKEKFRERIAELAGKAKQKSYGTEFYPFFLFIETVFSGKGKGIEYSVSLKPGKEPLGTAYLEYMSAMDFDKAQDEIEKRYDRSQKTIR
jgi:hypothetical protein